MTTSDISEDPPVTTPMVRPRVRIHADPFPAQPQQRAERPREVPREAVFDVHNLDAYYGGPVPAVAGVTMKMYRGMITAIIGPSGCGKSTFIRTLNRMNDSITGFRVDGQVLYHGHDIYAGGADRVEVRRRIGMVFQKPNPFPKSIYENVAYGPKVAGTKGNMDDIVGNGFGRWKTMPT